MITKTELYNITLGLLLLSEEIENAETDTSRETKILNTFFETSRQIVLSDLNLDSMSTVVKLALIKKDPTIHWLFSYDYPVDSALFRRIVSDVDRDNEDTHESRKILMDAGKKVVYSNRIDAFAEIIDKNAPIDAEAAIAWAHRLAMFAAPLMTGKGAKKLRDGLKVDYIIAKQEAQEKDGEENMDFENPVIDSTHIAARLS